MKTVCTPARVFALSLHLSRLKEATLKASKINLRVVALLTVVLCCAVAANAQSVTVSPGNLSFGVPTGSTVSAPETVIISVAGSGTVTVSSIQISSSDFTETDTCGINPSGSNTIGAPGSCAISVTFKPSQNPGVLETATLSISVTGGNGPFNIPLTGALGAIRLFDPVNVAISNPNASLPNPFTFGSTTLNLSCPASPTATLSSSPDGSSNVLVDNFVTLAVNGSPFGSGSPAGNVCTGGTFDVLNGTIDEQDCFTTNYQYPAGRGALNGDDPDTFTNAGNSVLQTYPNNAGGVSPINVSAAFINEEATTPTAIFSLLDGGGYVTSTTLYLVTSCSLTNATSGSETGNPTSQQPSQTLSFDTVVDHLDQYAFNYSLVPVSSITNPNATPVVTNNSITQEAYALSVAGTPFAGTTCIPLASLGGNCARKTQVCTLPGSGTASGANCPQTSAPDFLFTSTFDPVAPITSNTTFGFLEFNDAGGCPLEGPEANSSCPQNGLVSFSGPGINTGGRGAGSTNSSVSLVAGVTPPTTTVQVTPFFTSGSTNWTNASPTVTFTGNPAALTGYVAPINFIEYGVNPTSQGLPPTFPIPFPGNSTFSADTTFTDPTPCPSTIPALPVPSSFGPESATLGPYADGASNLLHYSTTDCATTHELLFTDNNGSWSTSFKSLTLTTDALPPTISITAPAASTAYPAYQKVKAAYACTDTESGVASCTGTLPLNSYIDTTPTNGLSTAKSFTVNAVDNVGNAAPLTVNYSVSCNYAAVGINPSAVTRPALVNITTSVIDCMSAPQNVKVQFSVSGPIGKNCGNASTVLLTTPPFTIKSGASNSITFPFPIAKNACAGSYTVTTTTLQGSTTIDTVNSTLTVQ